jgi:ABC-type glycerol-3-phosphate transport system permease component
MGRGLNKMKAKNVYNVIIFVVLFLVSLVFVIPFLWTFISSIKPDNEIYSTNIKILPTAVSWIHYQKVFTQLGDFLAFFRNSLVVSFFSVALVVIFSTTMGYSLSKLKYFGKPFFAGVILLVLTIPYVIYLIPIYIMESNAAMLDTCWGLILPYVATNLPLAVFIMQSQFNSVPKELSEAARIDGCNQWKTFYKIMVPVVKPGIATVIIFTFITVWGEFTYARTLTTTPKSQTLSVGITFLRDEAASWQYGTLCATIVLSLIPTLIIFLAMQKYLVKGIMEGAVKG